MRCLTDLLLHWLVWWSAEHFAWQGGPGWLCPRLHRELVQAVPRPVTSTRPRSHCRIKAFRGVCQWSRVVRCGWSGWVGRRQPYRFGFRADCTQNLPAAARGRGEDPQPRTRAEVVPGAFFEYTWTAGERLVTVAGLRADFHNLYGTFASPRLLIRYSLAEETSLKFVYGRGFRTANVFMEQLGTWASNRRWIVEDGLLPEMATNLGLNLVSKFKLNSRDASFSIDGYYTNFDNRVVADLYHSSNSIVVYNLTNSQSGNTSYSTTLQAEFDWSAHRRLDIRAAYRWVDAKRSKHNGC